MKLKHLPLISAIVAMFLFFFMPVVLITTTFFSGGRIYFGPIEILYLLAWLGLTALVGWVFSAIPTWILKKMNYLKELDGQNDEQPDKTKKPVS